MRITDIQTFDLNCDIEPSFGWSQGWISKRNTTIVKISTDSGLVGWGEGAASPIIRDWIGPLLIGSDPMQSTLLWELMFSSLYNGNNFVGIAGSAVSAIDIALWDIAGKASNLPIHTLLGGKIRDRIPVYATGLYYTENEMPKRLLTEAKEYVDQGFKGMKTKVGGLDIDKDVERVKAIREAIGPNIRLMIDANEGYNAASAIQIGEKLSDLDISWFEEPVNAKDIDAYIQVKNAISIPIAGGENLRSRFEFRDYISRRAYDIVQPDVMHCGGITEMVRIAAIANAHGIQVNPHVWGSPIMIAASLHVTSTIPPCPTSRVNLPYVNEPVMEFDRTPSDIREKLCNKPFNQEGSSIAVPNGPGLGIEVNEKAIIRMSEL